MTEQQPKRQKTFHDNCKSHHRKKHFLEVGQRGFLATCNFREKECVRECYNILNQYADELYGPMKDESEGSSAGTTIFLNDDQSELDIADDLQREVDATKAPNKANAKHRFQNVDTGTTNCIFIKTTLTNPVELAVKIIQDIFETKHQKSRFLLRLIPIEAVCKANMPDIIKTAGLLFDKHFLKEGHTYSIVFNKRYNNNVKRDAVIRELAEIVAQKNVHNKVDLGNPERSVIVEVIKGLCCLSVVERYLKYKKYNIVEIATATEERVKQKETSNGDGNEESIAVEINED